MMDRLCWYVIHTHSRQEQRADRNLNNWDVVTLSPKIKTPRYNSFTGKPVPVTNPLFPCYIFARFKLSECYHKVRYAGGVHCIVGFDDRPTPVTDEIIDAIQSRMDIDGVVRLSDVRPRPEFRAGEQVVVNQGLASFTGIFERQMKDSDRVRILLQTVNYQAHIEVGSEFVARLEVRPDAARWESRVVNEVR